MCSKTITYKKKNVYVVSLRVYLHHIVANVIDLVYPICFYFKQECPFQNSSPVNDMRYKTLIVPACALLLG